MESLLPKKSFAIYFSSESSVLLGYRVGPAPEAVILQSFGVGGLPGGGSGPLAQAVEEWLSAGKTIVVMTQVP